MLACIPNISNRIKPIDSSGKLNGPQNENQNKRLVKLKNRFGKTIGEGGYSVVKRVVHKITGAQYACKIMQAPKPGHSNLDGLTQYDITLEIQTWSQLKHENVIRFKEFFKNRDNIYIISEYCSGGELLNYFIENNDKVTVDDTRIIFRQILKGIEYLHSQGVVHRDIKLENILLKKPNDISRIAIADFGFAKRSYHDNMNTICGSPQYIAPEIIASATINKAYGAQVDLWSTGVLFYWIVIGYPPFHDNCEPRMYQQVLSGKFRKDEEWNKLPEDTKDLIEKLLEIDSKKRLTAKQALNHKFFKK